MTSKTPALGLALFQKACHSLCRRLRPMKFRAKALTVRFDKAVLPIGCGVKHSSAIRLHYSWWPSLPPSAAARKRAQLAPFQGNYDVQRRIVHAQFALEMPQDG